MQDFDEGDYPQHKFAIDREGNKLRFDDEEGAIKYLNDNYNADKIDPDYLTPQHESFLL